MSASLGTTGNNFANLKVEVRISQFLLQLVDCNCDCEILEEVLGVIEKIWIYINSKLLRFNFLSEQRISDPQNLVGWLGLCRAWS